MLEQVVIGISNKCTGWTVPFLINVCQKKIIHEEVYPLNNTNVVFL